MIQSMTGFGRGEHSSETKKVTVEIKAVNHRYSEVQVKLPRKYTFVEERLRRYIAMSLSRGKVDVYIKVEDSSLSNKEMNIDKELADKYYEKIMALAVRLEIPMNLGIYDLLQFPGVMQIEETEEAAEQVWIELKPSVDEAVNQLIEMRRCEGKKLAEDFISRLAYLEELRKQLLDLSPQVVESYRNRLLNRVKELKAEDVIDENRIAVETALFADRASINEELVRLDSHIQQFSQLITETHAVGRKLDFLCQEMNREVNTTGSKANDIEITKIVVEMKSELEKLREQVQNVE